MDKEKAKALSETLARYEELQENGSVNLIEFHTADGKAWRTAASTRRPSSWNTP